MDAMNQEESELEKLQNKSLAQNPVVRQLGVMIGIAASVALGVAVVLWSQTPNYSLLFGSLGQKDAAEVITALQQAGIDFRVDETNGAVMVPSSKLRDARMKLAGQGLPRSDSLGFELLQQETGFGTSRALEAARFHRALEGELARTIATLANIQSARVHLATPKQSVFVRKRKKPSASVVLKLYNGHSLEKEQVAAIVHLIASSVPELETGQVTVVDQKGSMLSGRMRSNEMMLTASQFDYTKQLEEHYRQRVENILIPILGADRVRAQVTAELDFTVTEQTAERFNPDLPALRSEQTQEQASVATAAGGVPGALSNQPPAAGTAPEQLANQDDGGSTPPGAIPQSSSKRATRNYELDKTISHTRLSSGGLRRLSVAVVVDDQVIADSEGQVNRTPRSPEEINRITQLVQEAIGYSATRGDTVRVINASFMTPPAQESLPELPIWEQPWVWDLAKQASGLILVLLLILLVLRPTMKRLTSPPVVERLESESAAGIEGEAGAAGEGVQALEGGATGRMQLPGPEHYEDTLEAARGLVQEDSKRVAQVVKSWVSENAG
jgi:flagellar M-ring protein FliF